MTRWLRFALFGSFLAFGLGVQAGPIRQSLRLAVAPRAYAPEAPPVLALLILLAVAAAYAVWLAGATVERWRMPLVVHAVPIALVIFSAGQGPLAPAPVAVRPTAAVDRAVAAMRVVAERIAASGPADPCVAPDADRRRWVSGPGLPSSGYRSYGASLSWSLEAIPGGSASLAAFRGERPAGTLLIACDPPRRFALAAVVTDALPTGRPIRARDGVGRVAIVGGEVR